jgi:hypothetical protein
MSLEKCQKYLYKLSNTNIDDNKFGLYLSKLNYWYEQMGGGKDKKKPKSTPQPKIPDLKSIKNNIKD